MMGVKGGVHGGLTSESLPATGEKSADQDLPYHHNTVNACTCTHIMSSCVRIDSYHVYLYLDRLFALMQPLAPTLSVAAATFDNYSQSLEAEKRLNIFIKMNFEPLSCNQDCHLKQWFSKWGP